MGEVISASWRRAAIILYATVVLAIGWSYGFWRIHNDRAVTLQTSHQQLATLSKALASQVEAMVNDGAGAARAGANVLADFPEAMQSQRILSDMLTGGSYVRALFVVIGDRMIIANAGGESLTQAQATWLKDLYGSSGSTWIGPIITEGSDIALPIAQRILRSDGVRSWAGALVRISDLQDVYRELQFSRIMLSLVSLEGRVIVQLPVSQDSMMNVDIRDSEIYRQFSAMPVQPMTLLVGPRPMTGELRQFAVSRLDVLPLLATSSRSVDDILVEWRERKQLSLQLLFVATVIVYALAIALQLLLNRRFIALEALAEARRAQLNAKESLARELLRAQEQERKRLAGELHDGIGQNLSLLRNRAVLLQRAVLPPEAAPHAKALLDLSTESIQDLRNVAQNLRPIHLEELGVSASLRSLMQRVAESSELKVQFRIEDIDDVVRGDCATHVYRIVQEAINNVIRHAAASNLVVEVIRDITSVVIDIRDDGRGCDLSAGLAPGLGLLSIRERCGILRAQLQMDSARQQGMHIRIRIPLEAGNV